MLHHISIGVADVERAARFYDAVLGALGFKRVMEFMPYAVGYGETAPVFWVQLPHDQKPASVGNGAHFAFNAKTEKSVYDFHEAAMGAGATDEGGPGPRPDYSPDYYGAFVRDPDGNKIEAVYYARPAAKPVKAKRKTKAAPKKAAKKAAPKKTVKKAAKKSAKKAARKTAKRAKKR
jgi:catechol 2,3-dioxygenase-like lactoylglutathione lyase family enzyme